LKLLTDLLFILTRLVQFLGQ